MKFIYIYTFLCFYEEIVFKAIGVNFKIKLMNYFYKLFIFTFSSIPCILKSYLNFYRALKSIQLLNSITIEKGGPVKTYLGVLDYELH